MSTSSNDLVPPIEPNGARPEGAENGEPKSGFFQRSSPTVRALLRTIVIFCLVLLAIEVSLVAFKFFRSDTEVVHSDLDIIAAIDKSPNGLGVAGRVLYEGEPATNARVWCIAKDEAGNRFSPTNVPNISGGHFRLEGLPQDLADQDSEVRIYALSTLSSLLGSSALRGETIIMTKGLGRQVNIMDSKLWPSTLAFFCVSIFVGMAIQVVSKEWRRQLYIASVMTALALTAAMLFAIAEAYMRVKASVRTGQIWSVGFISIFKGTYVKDTPDQWLLSFTGPPSDGTVTNAATSGNKTIKGESAQSTFHSPASDTSAATANLVEGLGAPMWVVFLSVIGAALSTVALIVKEIRSPPPFFADDPVELRERMLSLVQNQFFMLFAPLGSIFVYQGLVLASAAVQPFVVALAAMGAGATLNSVLSVAVAKASDALRSNSQKEKETSSANFHVGKVNPAGVDRGTAKSPAPTLGKDPQSQLLGATKLTLGEKMDVGL